MIRITVLMASLLAATAAAQDAAPAPAPTIRMADLPKILDHAGTLDDATPDSDGVRRVVHMGGLDKITARTFDAPVVATVKFKKLLVTARDCYVRPPEETPETTVFIEIAEPAPDNGDALHRLFSGWMFASSPGLNALEHPVYDVWVIGCQVDDPSNPGAASSGPRDADVTVEEPSVDDTIEDDDSARE